MCRSSTHAGERRKKTRDIASQRRYSTSLGATSFSAWRQGKSEEFFQRLPVKLLEQTDENIIAEQVVEVLNDESKLQSVFGIFFTLMEKLLKDASTAQVVALRKSLDDLTDDEIMQAVRLRMRL